MHERPAVNSSLGSVLPRLPFGFVCTTMSLSNSFTLNLKSFVAFNKLEPAVEEYKKKAKAINDKNKNNNLGNHRRNLLNRSTNQDND